MEKKKKKKKKNKVPVLYTTMEGFCFALFFFSPSNFVISKNWRIFPKTAKIVELTLGKKILQNSSRFCPGNDKICQKNTLQPLRFSNF
jgi:hypothetical protein